MSTLPVNYLRMDLWEHQRGLVYPLHLYLSESIISIIGYSYQLNRLVTKLIPCSLAPSGIGPADEV